MVSSLDTLLYPTLVPSTSNQVHLPIGQTTLVTHTESASLFANTEVKNVLYLPHFTYNVISISKLIKELNR